MADPVSVRVRGVPELVSGSRRLFERIGGEAAPEALGRIARDAGEMVQARVPRVSGTLAGSASGSRYGDKGRVQIGAGVRYAGWIEFGGTRGRPYKRRGRYLYPTALKKRREVIKAARLAAAKEIGRFRWPRP